MVKKPTKQLKKEEKSKVKEGDSSTKTSSKGRNLLRLTKSTLWGNKNAVIAQDSSIQGKLLDLKNEIFANKRSLLKVLFIAILILSMVFPLHTSFKKFLDPQKLIVDQTELNALDSTNYNADDELRLKIDIEIEAPLRLKARSQAIGLLGEVEINSTHIRLMNLKSKDFSDKVELVENGNGDYEIVVEPNSLPPGQYTLTVDMIKDGIKYSKSEVFTYGVLAVNTNKASYLQDEEAQIYLGVLDPYGFTICDGDLLLSIEDPLGNTSEVEIIPSGECERNNITNIPDYSSSYKLESIGEYSVTLTNQENGISTTDTFKVVESLPFSIERVSPTSLCESICSYKHSSNRGIT